MAAKVTASLVRQLNHGRSFCEILFFVPNTVSFDPRLGMWFFGGKRRYDDGSGSIVITHSDLSATKAADLSRELRKARQLNWEPPAILVDVAPEDQYWGKGAIVEPVTFTLHDDGKLAIECDLTSHEYFDEDDEFFPLVERLIGPLLQRTNSRLLSVASDGGRPSAPYYYRVKFSVVTWGRNLHDLYQVGQGVKAIFDASVTGELTRETAADLVAGGRADLLQGLPEGPWLDVKSQHYDLTTDRGKISLAEAVSRFANAEEGGIVIVGMDTKRVAGGEVIRSIKPVPIIGTTIRRYRQAIESRLFPFPFGLEITAVEINPHEGLIIVSIPRQEEELKPFLVHGAIVGGRTEGAYISIVRRSGEDSIPITAQQIHSTLAAGRALLRRGYLYPPEE
ncbi:AlbA family DNA-binding domain-containing protein [Micromonospora noduli]|uniref:AlbA family DNA-binding domain-containing protein n=1 Tax=Micromonospora noduli TaxID=709876 RepID=UPI000DC026F6|nr:hypothetical protein [Micromonospora noduli]KAB1912281.1 hypothetical protein F8280_33410 [Micromonospora noduli]RAN97770.1 hypothetical protein GUI43_06155 [Micromonospora noduli]RAO15186.1 hypothetical protein LUPAC07_03461 [Micromonospora noduli]RAO42671.1 hypothetical protein ONO86_03835 [Micromonospora noduli]